MRILIYFILFAASCQALVLDRIAASLGKQLVLESEVLRSLRVAAFLDQKEPDMTAESKRRSAERLVDQLLMVREANENRVTLPGEDEGNKLLASAAQQFASREEYQRALQKYGLTEAEIKNHLLAGYRMLRFTDLRFKPEVQVTEAELSDFYQILAAGWRRNPNGTVPSFEESREQVQQMLVDQKATQKLDAWLASARVQLGVSYRERVFE